MQNVRKNILNVFFIISTVAALQLINVFILARNLSKESMGLFSLVSTIMTIVSQLALLGICIVYIRFFSKESIENYNWKKPTFKILMFCSSLAFIIIVALSNFYSFGTFVFSILVILTIGTMIHKLFSSILRAQKKYELSMLYNRLTPVIFFLFLLILLFSQKIKVRNVFIFYVLALTLSLGFLSFFEIRGLPKGNKNIPKRVFIEGFLLFGVGISTSLMLTIDKLFIGKMLSYLALAIYTVMLSVMRIFDFAVEALWHVLIPHLNSKKFIKPRRIIFYLFVIAILIGLFYWLAGPYIIHILFKGRYDAGIVLFPLFIAIGMVRILYTYPACIISAKADRFFLKQFLFVNIITVLLNICLNFYFILKWELIGAALATLVAWSLRTIYGYVISANVFFLTKKTC